MDRPITSVFIGQFALGKGEGSALAVHGLGSCVALILFDPRLGLGGLAHVLLPGSKPTSDSTVDLPAKHAASALDALLSGLAKGGARPGQLRAALVGGASMFDSDVDLEQGRVGQRNIDSLRSLLAGKGLPVAMEETGGNMGRTVVFDIPEGRIRIRTLRGGWIEKNLR